MKIYVAGPMTGLPEFNYPVFNMEAARLRSLGHEVENPAENPTPPCKSWEGFMRLGIAQLIRCDAIVLLKNWHKSRGARLELTIAADLGISIYHIGDCPGAMDDGLYTESEVEEDERN